MVRIVFTLTGLMVAWLISLGVTPTTSPQHTNVKQKEMIHTSALINTKFCSGSGTIVNKVPVTGFIFYKYYVLTNAHVTRTRLVLSLSNVDFMTGKLDTKMVDTGCFVTVLDNCTGTYIAYEAEVLEENLTHDIAIISFESNKVFEVASVATKEMLDEVCVFDEVFAIGCQLGDPPSPTVGIISRILTDDTDNEKWVIYYSTAQLAPGSSGGGLFREYEGHYYLIGIPFSAGVAHNGQFIPHLGHSISIDTVRRLIGFPAICN